MLRLSERYVVWAPVALRLALGSIFFAHGAQKVFGWWEGGGLQATAGFLGSMGFTPPMFWAIILVIAEFVGGIFLLLGLLVRLMALLIAISQVVAVILVHLPRGFFAGAGGFEFNMALIAMAVALILTGAGALSLDRLFRKRDLI